MNKVPSLRFKEFSGEWEEKELGDISDVSKLAGFEFTNYVIYEDTGKIIALRGLNIKNNKLYLNDVKYIDKSDFSKLKRSKLYKNDLMFTYVGTIGEVALIPEEDKFYLAPNVCRIRSTSKVNAKYLLFVFNSNIIRNEIYKYLTTTSQPALSMENIRKFLIKLPCLKEQKKIADFLSSVDKKISIVEEKLNLFNQYKKGIMQKIFSQKLRFKDENGNNYPQWKEKRLGDIGTFFSGGTPKSDNKKYYNGDIPFIKSGEISKDKTEQFITKLGLDNSSAKMVKKGDLLFALYGATSGECAISKINGAINQAVLVIRTEENTIFLFNYFKFYKDNIIKKFLQGGQGNLSAEIIKMLNINFPCIEEQKKIADFLSAIDDKIENISDNLENLKLFKKSMLQKMFV